MVNLAFCYGPQWTWIREHWKEAFFPANWSNWALVVVGAAAGYLAWRTLKGIEKQAGIMREQSDQMAAQTLALTESVRISGKSVVLQFRPKIIVRVGKVSLSNHPKEVPEPRWVVSYSVINAGGSSCRI